jgi:hypothetical protein
VVGLQKRALIRRLERRVALRGLDEAES